MKRILTISMVMVFIVSTIFCMSASASDVAVKTESSIEVLENGDFIRTYITYYEEDAKAATKSGSKTKEYVNSSGDVMWSVTVNGTFTYNGTTSSCTKASHSATAFGSDWSIKSSSASKSGNCATATATATCKGIFSSKDYTMTVNLYCSPYGILS